MPIYDYTYQTWKGERRGPLFRWMAIPKFTIMEFFGNRLFIWLFSMAWFQFLFRLAWVYLLINAEVLKPLGLKPAMLPQADAFFFKQMIDIQIAFCIAFAFMLGANLISRDLAHNALVLYVSKPISRWEYFFGKFSLIFFLSMLLTWVQTAFLYLLLTAASPAESSWRIYFWDHNAIIFVWITLYCVVIATTISMLILAASSLVRNGRKAGLLFAMYVIGSAPVAGVISQVTEISNMRAFSIVRCIYDLGYAIFHLRNRSTVEPMYAWIGVVSVWALCGLIIYWRMNNAAKFGR